MLFIDTHCHLHFPGYDTDRLDVHARMKENYVKAITVGTAMRTSRDAVAYAGAHEDVWATVGYHPSHVTSSHEDPEEPHALEESYNIDMLKELASDLSVIAIGECGLDYHQMDSEWDSAEGREKQRRIFEEQIVLAATLDKTLVVHLRDAEADMLEVLQRARTQFSSLRIVMHAFTSTAQMASDLLDLGVWFGVGGIVTFKPRKTTPAKDTLPEIVKRLPPNRILLETDAPWLAPVPVRGMRNEPAHVVHIARFIAGLRGTNEKEIGTQTTKNAERCFQVSF